MRANSKTFAVLGLLTTSAALVGCDQPDPLVICHNSNCAEPTDVRRDDTLEGLRASLALEYNGRPVLDGMEMDSFWRASDDKCLYAHDLETVCSSNRAGDGIGGVFRAAGADWLS
jgi:hypothetical protein